MKQKHIFLLIGLLLALTLSGCGNNGLYQVMLVTEGEHTITAPTTGELIIMGGEVTIEENAVLDGSAHLVSGTLNLDGTIREDISALGGTLVLGDDAAIEGILNHGGGTLAGNQVQDVAGKVNTGTGIQIPELAGEQRQTIGGLAGRWLFSAALTGLLALILHRYLSHQMLLVGETTVQHVWVAVAMGLLVGIVGLTLLVLLAYTILLIPVAIFGFFILGFSIFYGWISFALYLGRAIAPQYAASKPKLFVFGSVFVVMVGISLVGVIPAVGSILSILFAVIGLGAVFLTRFGMRRFVPESVFIQS